MYSTYNEGKSAVAEKIIRTLKNKFISIWHLCQKNVCFDIIDDINLK